MRNSPSAVRAATHVCSVGIAAVVMTWPALYNRYPLLYPDSVSYLGDGWRVARALFLHKFSGYYGLRSPLYSLGILPLHWNITPWPIVAFNAFLMSYVLWLLVRSLLPRRTLVNFLGLVIPLSLLTGLGWLVGWIMPDILGPVLYLSFYLLVFAKEALSPTERLALALIAWWAVASHATHLLLAGALCVVLIAVLAVQEHAARRSLQAVGPVVMIVLVAALAQVALNEYLYGQPSLNGERPPFLLARVIADGPGKRYLEQHCGELRLAICAHVRDLPDNTDDFLWGDHAWNSPEQEEQLRHEEMAVVLGSLRAYPREELFAAAHHFWRQLLNYGLWSYDPNQWTSENIDISLPGSRVRYLRSRQAQGMLHEQLFSSLQDWTLIASLLVIVAWTLFARRWWSRRLVGLTAIITFIVVANAAVTGNLSNVEDRYQASVIWLVPLLAGVFILTWLDRRSKHVEGRA
ncbi:MAG TPA: hypothetical protein VHM88_06530 [Candidatus Acidoferrales bacterium]|nr:hypothetical protein [Candidatus Acidoferrales bacterium]